MVRYIRSDELYHSGVKGMKWYRRLYQYKDGSYTPLGRIHYGIGINKKDMTGAERIKETAKAARDTAAGYGLIKYKKTETQSKASTLSKLQYRRQQKADEKRAEEAMRKRQEVKEQAKAAKEKLKADVAARKKAQEEAFKKQQEENIKANQERKQKYEDNQKRLQEELAEERKEIQEREAQKQTERNVDQAKSDRFDNFTNEDLKKFTERTRLEAEATKAQNEARLAKWGVPLGIAKTLLNYGKTGIDAYNAYQDITKSIDAFKDYKLDREEKERLNPANQMSKDLLKKIKSDYDSGLLTDPDNAAAYKEDLYKELSMIEATSKIFEATRRGFKSQSKDNGKDKNNRQEYIDNVMKEIDDNKKRQDREQKKQENKKTEKDSKQEKNDLLNNLINNAVKDYGSLLDAQQKGYEKKLSEDRAKKVSKNELESLIKKSVQKAAKDVETRLDEKKSLNNFVESLTNSLIDEEIANLSSKDLGMFLDDMMEELIKG